MFDKLFGKKEEEKQDDIRRAYDVYDQEGNRMGGAFLKNDQKIEPGDKVYVNKESKEVSPSIKDSLHTQSGRTPETSISLGKNGDITVKAPSLANKNETFRKQLEPALNIISQNYKLNKDYKYELYDGQEARTSEEWLKYIEKDLPLEVSKAIALEETKQEWKDKYGVDASDEDVTLRNQVTLEYKDHNGETVKLKDYDRQALPTRIKNLNVFKNIEGWDETTQTVDYANLKKAWDRKEVWEGGASDEDFLEVFREVNAYFDEGDFSDAKEFAAMLAIRDFVNGKDPDAGFIQGIADVAFRGGTGAITGAATFDSNVINALEGVINSVNNFSVGLAEKVTGKDLSKDYNQVTWWGDNMIPVLEEWKENFKNESIQLNDRAGAAYNIADTLTPILMQAAIGDAVAKAMVSGVGGIAGKVISESKAGRTIAEGAKGIGGGAVTAEELANNLFTGTKFLLKLQNANKANTAVSAAISSLRAADMAGRIISPVAELAAQSVFDAAITDSKLFRQFLEGDSDGESKAYMLEQFAQNVSGFAIGIGAMKGGAAFGRTELGRVLNAKISPWTSLASAKIRGLTDKMRISLHGGDEEWLRKKMEAAFEKYSQNASAWNEKKARRLALQFQAQTSSRLTSRASELAFKETRGMMKNASDWDDLVSKAGKVKSTMIDKIADANFLADTQFAKDVSAITQKLSISYDFFGKAQGDYATALSAVLKAEDADQAYAGAGKRFSKSVEVGEAKTVVAAMRNETNQYANALYRSSILEKAKAIERDGNVLKAMEKESEHLQGIVAKFESEHTKELIEATNNLVDKAKICNAANQDVRVAEKVMSGKELEDLRNLDMFKEGYMRQQRVSEWSDYVKRGGNLSTAEIRGEQAITWGSTDEFQDLTMVLFDDINQTSKMVLRKRQTAALKNLGYKVDTIVSGSDVNTFNKVKRMKTDAVNALKENASKAAAEIEDSFFSNFMHNKKKPEAEIAFSDAKTKIAGERYANRTLEDIASTVNERKRFIRGVSDDDLDMIIDTVGDHPFGIPLTSEENFQEFLGQLPKKTADDLKAEIKGYEGILYDTKASKRKAVAESFEKRPIYNKQSLEAYMRQNKIGKGYIPKTGNLSYLNNFVTDSKSAEKVFSKQQFDELKGLWDDYNKSLKATKEVTTEAITLDNFMSAVQDDPNIFNRIKRSYAENSDRLLGDEFVDRITAYAKQQKRASDAKLYYDDLIAENKRLKKAYNLTQVEDDLNGEIDDYIDAMVANIRTNQVSNDAIRMLDNSDDAIEYYTLKAIKQDKSEFSKKLKERATKQIREDMLNDTSGKFDRKIYTKGGKEKVEKDLAKIDKISKKWGSHASYWAERRISQRLEDVESRLYQAGSDLINYDHFFGKLSELNESITNAKRASTVIKTYDANGLEEYVELSPSIASMITMRPPELRRSVFGEIEKSFINAFRYGTTGGLVPGSLVRQFFKDTGSAFVAGDMTMTTAQIKNKLVNEFGDEIADRMSKEMPDVWATLLEKSGGDVESATRMAIGNEFEMGTANISQGMQADIKNATEKAVSREFRIGAANTESELQSKLYSSSKGGADIHGLKEYTRMDSIRDGLEEFREKTEFLNDIREKTLRNSVYNNNFYKGIKEGMSMETARKYAEFMQANATTNFTRASYHFAVLTDTVPYLNAALNGTKSFWRLLELDPVGMSSRIIGGYVVPVIALTNLSLSNEEDKRIYQQIPEYQKSGTLTFVINGQIMSIPVPEEISKFVKPVQNMVESMQGGNSHMFNELMLNDLLGFSPINLEGFVNIDADKILSENIVDSKLIPGVSKMISGMMSPLAKSGFMAVTGYDPYSMKYIDTSYTMVGEEGDSVVMDYKSGGLAKFVASITGDTVSAPMAQAFLKNLVGENNLYALDLIADLSASVVKGDAEGARDAVVGEDGFLSNIVGDATGVILQDRYGEESNLAWNRAVSKMYREKEALVKDKEYQADVKAYNSSDTSEEAKKVILSRIKTKQEAYQQKVHDMSKNLISEYDGTFDKNKFLSVLSLMRFDNVVTGDIDENKYSSYLSSQEKQLAKAKAIETMQQMGFDSPNDDSILGYYGKNQDGEVGIMYNTPLSILNFEKTQQLQDKMALANIRDLVNDAGLYNKHEAISNQTQPLFDEINKKGTSSARKKELRAKVDAIYANWNAEVMATIAPYVSQMTPEAAINNKQVRDFLETYVEVPDFWEVDDKGKRVYLGKQGSKKAAYLDSYIKKMYKINDPYKGQY